MNDQEQTVDETYLMDKTFYFILDRNDSYGYPYRDIAGPNPDDKHHVEIAIYRLHERGKDIDFDVSSRKDIPALILRSKVEEERKNIFLVLGGGESKTDFAKPVMAPFPAEGCAASKMPGLVIVKIPKLEGQRGHIAYARVFDGNQWGAWAPIPQTCMEIVDEKYQPLADIRVSNLKPKISASVEAVRVDRKDAKSPIALKCVVEDYVPITAVYLNGVAVAGLEKSEKEGRYQAKLPAGPAATVKIVDGCQRIEIVAENALGGRSQVVKLYHPEYAHLPEDSPSREEPGKVIAYVTDGADFKMESEPEKPQLFRILYHAIPYRLPPMAKAGENKKPEGEEKSDKPATSTPPRLPVGLRIGNGKEVLAVDLLRRDGGQSPYMGAKVRPPQDIKIADRAASELPAKIIIDISVELTGAAGRKKSKLRFKESTVSIDPNSWVWQSEPMLLIPGGGRMGNAVSAELGDLLETYVNVRWNYLSSGASEETGGLSDIHDHLRVYSPKSAAAGVRPVTYAKSTPLSALKNGDIIGVEAFAIGVQPKALVKIEEPHDHKKDNASTSPFALADGTAQKTKLVADNEKKFQARLENLNEYREKDKIQRDEPDVAAVNFLELGAEKIKYEEPLAAIDRGSNDENLDSSIKPEPGEPGRVKFRLASKNQRVRLMTQEYFTSQMVGDRKKKGETRHQILPYGFFSIAVVEANRANEKPAVENHFRTLEIAKRWYLEAKKPSIQPAFAGTNPRVGGPGTHRVGGLYHNLQNGSIYVHNGELFQAAEDLHIDGKVMDLTLRRTYLSHSLFTSSLGRNWDWIGNMRLIELPNGEAHLMNGESQIEIYAPSKDAPAASVNVTHLVNGKFDYSEIYKQRQYNSPTGVYRSLVKAKPVVLGGEDAPNPQGEAARFYLVDKHGTIWTFVEDVRFADKNIQDNKEINDVENPAEPGPGVRAHWLLVSIHDRRQSNCIKLQRDASGLLRGIIDNHGRVVKCGVVDAKAAFDRFTSTIVDFTKREISFSRQGDITELIPDLRRNLRVVEGPAARNAPDAKPILRHCYYNYLKDGVESQSAQVVSTGGPLHLYTGISWGKLDDSWFSIAEFKNGMACKQLLRRQCIDPSTANERTEKPIDITDTFELLFEAAKTTLHVIEAKIDRVSEGGKSRYVFTVELADEGFAKIVKEMVYLKLDDDKPLSTEFEHSSNGEITKITLPAGNTHQWRYGEGKNSQEGNLIEHKEAGDRVTVKYSAYDLRFNFPKKIENAAYMEDKPDETAWVVNDFEYDETGNSLKIKEPAGEIGYSYRPSDGLCKTRTHYTGLIQNYSYYAGEKDRIPGDAHDRAGLLHAVQQTRKGMGAVIPEEVSFNEWESKLKTLLRPKPLGEYTSISALNNIDKILKADNIADYENGMIESYKPNLLGANEVDVDPDGVPNYFQFNELSLVLSEWTGIQNQKTTHSYVVDDLRETKQVIMDRIIGEEPRSMRFIPEGLIQVRQTQIDAVGNIIVSRIKDVTYIDIPPAATQPAATQPAAQQGFARRLVGDPKQSDLNHYLYYNSRGEIVYEIDSAGISTEIERDPRGLAIRRTRRDSDSDLKSTEEFTYDDNGNLVLHVDAAGWASAWRYDASDKPTHILEPGGVIRELAYGVGGLVHREIGRQAESIETQVDQAISNLKATLEG